MQPDGGVTTAPLPARGDARAVRPRSFVGGRLSPEAAWALACVALDSAMLVGAALASGYGAARAGAAAMPGRWVIAFGVVAMGLWAVRGLYRPSLASRLVDDATRIAAAAAVAGMIVLSVRLLLGADATVATETVRLTAFAAVYVAAGRVAFGLATAGSWRARTLERPTLIVGAGKVGRLVARRLLERGDTGLRPVAFLDVNPLPGEDGLDLPILTSSWDLDEAVERYGVRQVVFTFSTASNDVFLELFKRCTELGLAVSIVPRLFERIPDRLDVTRLGGVPLMTVRPANPRGFQFAVKYILDRVVAGALVLLASPVLVLSALAVWIDSGRPVLFRQTRVGRDGREFEMLKFRSMTGGDAGPSAELLDALRSGGVEGADRRTRVGRLLRRLSLDELPQLFNVLKGEMSLVGPRPERVAWVSEFDRRVHRWNERTRVKGGITGWAQVHGLRGQTSLADRAEWDNYYIENFSLWLDFKILLMTVGAVLRSVRSTE